MAADEQLDDCDLKARTNFHAIKAILNNKMRANNTILYELAGVFSNKQRPLKQVIVHYKVFIPVSDCGSAAMKGRRCDLDHQLSDNPRGCPNDFHCISADYIWARYPTTAHDVVFRDLDVCPLVIGDYEQRQITIYFTLKSPPSCNSSSVDEDTVAKEQFPCGWQCKTPQEELPSSGHLSEPFVQAFRTESPLDRALLETTTKVSLYCVDIVICIIIYIT